MLNINFGKVNELQADAHLNRQDKSQGQELVEQMLCTCKVQSQTMPSKDVSFKSKH